MNTVVHNSNSDNKRAGKKDYALKTCPFDSCWFGGKWLWGVLTYSNDTKQTNKTKTKITNITNKYWLLKIGSCVFAIGWEVLQCLTEATTSPTYLLATTPLPGPNPKPRDVKGRRFAPWFRWVLDPNLRGCLKIMWDTESRVKVSAALPDQLQSFGGSLSLIRT